MDDTQIRAELIEKFGASVENDEALLAECVRICEIFNESPEQLFWKWEASKFNTKKGLFTLAVAQSLKERLQREQEKKVTAQRQRASVAERLSRPRGTAGVLNIGRFTQTSIKSEPRSTPGFGSPSFTPQGRQSVAGPSHVRFHDGPLQTEVAKKGRAFRYMYEKVSERSELLDDRIDEFADIFRQAYSIEDFSDPAAITEDEVYIMGRVVLDAETSASGAKLNNASVVLESSRSAGSGVRIPLKFDSNLKLRGIAKDSGIIGLFPGAMVAARGRNGGGEWFLVSEMLSLPPLDQKNAKFEDNRGSGSTLVIASGPFTADADLAYEPWKAFVAQMQALKPDVILLTGPFVDTNHQKIKAGDVTKTPEEMFLDVFLEPLGSILDSKQGSIALLVPSVRDILSDHAVLPQSEFGRSLVNDPRVHLLPNPAKFSLDGRSFAVTSVDVLFHLKKEEFTKRGEEVEPTHFPTDEAGTDAFAALCRHVLRQRSLYPVFPVPTDLSHEINLDVSHMDGLALTYDSQEPAPDVLILPSRYKQFYKTVDGTTVINPSFVYKSNFATFSFGAPLGSQVEISRIGR